jgi:hypothetical protein
MMYGQREEEEKEGRNEICVKNKTTTEKKERLKKRMFLSREKLVFQHLLDVLGLLTRFREWLLDCLGT